MKIIFVMIGICVLLLSATSAFSDNSLCGVKKGTLTVVADGFKNDKGFAMFGLCNTAECFNNAEEKALLPQKVQIINGKATHDFKDVPFGEYAVTVYHDKNSNNKLYKSFLENSSKREVSLVNPIIKKRHLSWIKPM